MAATEREGQEPHEQRQDERPETPTRTTKEEQIKATNAQGKQRGQKKSRAKEMQRTSKQHLTETGKRKILGGSGVGWSASGAPEIVCGQIIRLHP